MILKGAKVVFGGKPGIVTKAFGNRVYVKFSDGGFKAVWSHELEVVK